MSHTPNKQDKVMATQVADMLASAAPDRGAILEILTRLGYNNNGEKPAATYEDDIEIAGNVGIYCPVGQNGQTYYERDPRCKERWSYYADVQVIPARTAKKRVVLLGESVARGFLLDPDFTPAFVLQSLLDNNSAGQEYEVIDLAETNLGMAGIRHRFEQCLVLQPDIIVFLAGNNWRSDLQLHINTDKDSYEQLRTAIDTNGGLEGVKPVVEAIFTRLITRFISETGQLAAQHNIPLFFVIPEFNLRDCESTPGERFVSHLPGRRMQEWLDLREKAEAARTAGNWQQLAGCAADMIAADITHPLGYEYLAQSNLQQADNEAARRNLELARDTALFCRTNSKPRIFEVVKTVMRNEFPKNGFRYVDLGEVFSQYLGGEVADRRLFLDYCHFSVEGMQVAMVAVANTVLEVVSGKGVESLLNPKSIAPDKDAYAYGHLFAAIHNAHWGQAYPILEYHAARALSYSRDIARIMIYYCDMMSRSTSNNLCKSFELLIKDRRLDKYVHTMIHPRNQKTMELSLVDAMVNAMKAAGIQMEGFVRDLRIREHGVQLQQLDLLHPAYHATSYDEYQGTKTAFFQSRDNRSRFFLPAAAGTTVILRITLRTRDVPYENARVLLSVGETFSVGLDAGPAWKDFSITIPGEHITGGINFIDIAWPWHFEATAKETAGRSGKFGESTLSLLDASFFVFGEIIKFSALAQQDEGSKTAIKEISAKTPALA